jgi:TonB family protein
MLLLIHRIIWAVAPLVGLVLLASQAVAAPLTGQVLNHAHQPLPGVVITLQNSAVVTTTNATGEFFLSADEVLPVLVFKYQGYQTQAVKVKAKGTVKITLYEVGAPALPPAAGLELLAEAPPTIDEPPVFPGGAAAYRTYLRDNLHYPALARDQGIAGAVLVGFVVDGQGRILNPEVAKGCDGLNEEALRLVGHMPWWLPARRAGQPVRATFYLRIKFALQ